MLNRFYFILLLLIGQYSFANEYQVVKENGKFGLKNTTTNEWSIPPNFEALGWSNGSDKVEAELIGAKLNEKWALLTISGSKVTQHEFAQLTPFVRETFIAAKRENYSIRLKYGLINNKGKSVVAFDHERLEIANGKLIATKGIGNSQRTGLLNYLGKTLLPFEYSNIKLLSPYRLEVTNLENRAALFSIEGIAQSAFDYEKIKTYQVGYFEVLYYGRRGLINDRGDLIIPPLYKEFDFSNGVANGLPFTQWDAYEDSKFIRSYFFDEIFEIADNRFSVNSSKIAAIIDSEDQYLFTRENQKIIESQNALSIIENSENGYQGIITDQGRLLLNINYDSICFSKHYIAASIDKSGINNWQLFDFNGKQLNALSYQSISPYGNGFMASRKGKFGILNKYGEEASPFLYDHIEKQKNGLSIVTYQGRKGVIDQKGHWVITPYNDSISIGKRRIFIEQGSQFKIAEFNGHVALKTYDTLDLLPRGYSLKYEEGKALYSFSNERLLEPYYDAIYEINDNLYVLYRDDRIFFYRPSNKADFELDSEISRILNYSEGYIKIEKDGQFGFVDELGKLRIANRYQEAQDFSEGFAAVKLIGNWGYIDKSENLIIQPSFEEAQPFFNRLAIVKQGSYYGLIAPNTELVLNTIYDRILRFNDYMTVESDGLLGLVDSDGNLIKDCQYDEIAPLSTDIFQVRKGDKYGVIDIKGSDLVPINYSKIKMYGSKFYGALFTDWEPIRLAK